MYFIVSKKQKHSPLFSHYSDTSAIEDNSFRNHIH